MSKESHCRSCNARLIWAVTEKGHRIPIDFEPTENGNIVLQDRSEIGLEPVAVYPNAEALEAFKKDNARLHVSHFATCPQSMKWRKR